MTTTRGGGEIGLRSCAEATVIEDLLEVITPVSGLVKRNLDLIRQLGATATSELEAVEKDKDAHRKRAHTCKDELAKMQTLHDQIKRELDVIEASAAAV